MTTSYDNIDEQNDDKQSQIDGCLHDEKIEEMTDPKEINECELKIISKNSDVLGYNIDSKLIVWPERRRQATEAKEFLDSGGDIAVLSTKFKQPAERIKKAIKEELSKEKLLDDTLARLPDGTKFRITPHAPMSAFSVANSMHIENGKKVIHIDDNVMSQVEKIKKKSSGSDLIVVMSQLHINKNGALTSNIPEDASDYIDLCRVFVEQSGYANQSGKGLILELGNECNMCHKHGGDFGSEAFAEHVKPQRYADFYFETAKVLKSVFPKLKISLTGVAFYDIDFIKQVVDEIQKRKEREGVGQSLIDIISFHPYRKTVDVAAPVVSAESFGDNSEQTFDSQLENLRKIARPLGAEVTVGEISFYKNAWGASINENEQVKNAAHGREKGYFSYIWPGEQIVKVLL